MSSAKVLQCSCGALVENNFCGACGKQHREPSPLVEVRKFFQNRIAGLQAKIEKPPTERAGKELTSEDQAKAVDRATKEKGKLERWVEALAAALSGNASPVGPVIADDSADDESDAA